MEMITEDLLRLNMHGRAVWGEVQLSLLGPGLQAVLKAGGMQSQQACNLGAPCLLT